MSRYSKGMIWWPVLMLSLVLGGLLWGLNAQMRLHSRLLGAQWQVTQDRALVRIALVQIEKLQEAPSASNACEFKDNIHLLQANPCWHIWPQKLWTGRVLEYAFQVLPSDPNLGQLTLRIGVPPQVDQVIEQVYGVYQQGIWRWGRAHEVWR